MFQGSIIYFYGIRNFDNTKVRIFRKCRFVKKSLDKSIRHPSRGVINNTFFTTVYAITFVSVAGSIFVVPSFVYSDVSVNWMLPSIKILPVMSLPMQMEREERENR